MKFTLQIICSSCKRPFSSTASGEGSFPPAKCPDCGEVVHLLDPLTISVIADRLLLRSQREIEDGDFTLSILCSAIAVECALTQVFLKWKELEFWSTQQREPNDIDRDGFERDYKKQTSPGGFAKSADFVSTFLVGKDYDQFVHDFVASNKSAAIIKAGFPQYENQAKVDYIHTQLFAKRNRIMHWGRVDYNHQDSSWGLLAGLSAISVLKAMDHQRYLEIERKS